MLFLAITGFILMNALGIIFLPRFTVCMYIWYTIFKWGYLAKEAQDWMGLFVIIFFFATIAVLVWDVIRGVGFFEGKIDIF